MRDPRIKLNKPGEFRYSLHLEDVEESNAIKIPVEVDGLSRVEEVYVFSENPIKVPITSKLYFFKVRSLDSKFLSDVVGIFTYFNPSLDRLGIKKMIEYIGRYLTTLDEDYKPVISYEEYEPVVKLLYMQWSMGDGVNPTTDKHVLYSKDSMMSSQDKKIFSRQVRTARVSELFGEIIHIAAVDLIDNSHPLLKITNRKLLNNIDSMLDLSEQKKLKTINTLKKHIRPDTKDEIKVANETRYFLKDSDLVRFNMFLDMDIDTLDATAKLLKISKSKAVMYRQIKLGLMEENIKENGNTED